MTTSEKGKSPFYPGQPVPVELFVGRKSQIDRIVQRGVQQVSAGKPVSIFLQGEYGIGKSSIAGFIRWIAENEHKLHGIYAPLSGVNAMDGVGAAVLQATLQSGALDPTRSEKIRGWLSKYLGKQSLFGGLTINLDALKQDAPSVASGILPFLKEVFQRLKETDVRGIVLILDEINGIADSPDFAHFIKGLVDGNAMSGEPLPLLLMLCGVEERRREMIARHQPVDRIFDVIDINPMTDEEMREFFVKAYKTVQMTVQPDAMNLLAHYSAGFPKIMHLIGDAAFWIDKDGVIDLHNDAAGAVVAAAEDVGRKYVDQQVFKALRSKDYHLILEKIAQLGPDVMAFKVAEVEKGLTESEKRKFNNFLQKMKELNVLKSGDVRGEWVFTMRMVRFYIWLQSRKQAVKTGTQS